MSRTYVRPESIRSSMGGKDGKLATRVVHAMQLLEEAPLNEVQTVLDIGVGGGQISTWLAKKGKQVTATGLEIESYDIDVAALQREYGIKVVECSAENMPFPDESFDAVVMSHVLEHLPNVQIALQEVWRVLRDGGHLFVFVPPNDGYILPGHISMGWNVGQLMYVLLLANFEVREGKFIQHLLNVCGFVRKNMSQELPPLRSGPGDIHMLDKHGLFPLPIISSDGLKDGFWGNIRAVNWNPEHAAKLGLTKKRRLVRAIAGLVPKQMRGKLARKLIALSVDLVNSDSARRGTLNSKYMLGK